MVKGYKQHNIADDATSWLSRMATLCHSRHESPLNFSFLSSWYGSCRLTTRFRVSIPGWWKFCMFCLFACFPHDRLGFLYLLPPTFLLLAHRALGTNTGTGTLSYPKKSGLENDARLRRGSAIKLII